MGLDMYLYAERDRSQYCATDDGITEFAMAEAAGLDAFRVPDNYNETTTSVQAAYWRKANAIHAWFVYNHQGGRDECQPSGTIYTANLQDLVDLCQQVLDDPHAAPDLLPVQQGFFFGSYEYDDWYFEYIKYTRDRLTELIELSEKLGHDPYDIAFRYRSSW